LLGVLDLTSKHIRGLVQSIDGGATAPDHSGGERDVESAFAGRIRDG